MIFPENRFSLFEIMLAWEHDEKALKPRVPGRRSM
jgi:hypothetical protein